MSKKARRSSRKTKKQQAKKNWQPIGIIAIFLVAVILGYVILTSNDGNERVPRDNTSNVSIQNTPQTSNTVPIAKNDSRFPIAPANGEIFDQGKALYDLHCASCHGINGEGQQPDPLARGMAPPHTDAGHTWHHPDQQNFTTVWTGRDIAGNMPGFSEKMTADEIISVLAYIKTWWNEEALSVQTQSTISATGG